MEIDEIREGDARTQDGAARAARDHEAQTGILNAYGQRYAV